LAGLAVDIEVIAERLAQTTDPASRADLLQQMSERIGQADKIICEDTRQMMLFFQNYS